MQVARTGFRILRSAPAVLSSPSVVASSHVISAIENGGKISCLGLLAGSRFSSQAVACSQSTYLDKTEVSNRVVELLKSIPIIDPSKVNPTASFKVDLHLDTLDNVEVIMAAEEEFAVDIPNDKADKISTAAHLIDYIATDPHARCDPFCIPQKPQGCLDSCNSVDDNQKGTETFPG